jgi:hypothetical protein
LGLVHSPAQLPSVTRPRYRRGEWLVLICLVLGVLTALGVWIGRDAGYAMLKGYVESSAGQQAASRGMGKTIKIDGKFAPLHVEEWTIRTASFTSKGWPGEAIGGLDASGIRAEFDPSAVRHGAWRIEGVQIDRATINLRKPEDALKRPDAPKKPRPWYLFFLPTRVECGPITCPDAELLYSFQGKLARIHDANVQADLIGKDLKYTATSGVLEMPYLPPLHIQRLEMLVTRPFIRVYTAQLTGIDPADSARVVLSGTIGMRENKAIEASGQITEIPIEQILPEDLRGLIHGKATGKLAWKRDATGKNLDSDGEFSLDGARIDDLSPFKQLALLHGNADLTAFGFDTAACEFHIHQGRARLVLHASSAGKLTIVGTVDYEFATKHAQVDLAVTDLPLKTWLPDEFKPGAAGVAQAHMQWQGQLRTIRDSSGHVALTLDGGTIHTPGILRRLLAAKKLRGPESIQFKTAAMDVQYHDQTFELTRGDFDLPGILTAQVAGTLLPGNQLRAKLAWQGLTIEDWLPANLAEEFSGAIQGNATLDVRKWKMGDGSYAGQIKLVAGQLRYTPFQSLLARFLNDRALLQMPLTRASFSWVWSGKKITVTGLDLRAGDRLGVTGDFVVAPGGALAGTLRVGTRADYVARLAGLGEAVFDRSGDGLKWATVRLSGTVKKPKQDLASQLMAEVPRHPTAVFALGFKGVSWYVGNWFGAEKEWQRPADVSVKAARRS